MTLQQRTLPFAVLALLLPPGGGLVMAGPSPGPYPHRPASSKAPPALSAPLPVIIVEALYPGANAQAVADTVAAPIEQQVNGVEKLAYLRSRSTRDGHYTLQVVFGHGVDLNLAQVQVQNRVSLALPVLPDVVQQAGLTVKKGAAGVLAFVVVSSPDDRYDLLYLSNYATIQIQDELARLPGVAAVTGLGRRDFGMRVWLDPARLAALHLNAGDVVSALKDQNVEILAGQPPSVKGQNRPLTIQTLGRLRNAEQFADVILKKSAAGPLVRLKDVARVELGGGTPEGHALFDGKPVVVLAVHSLHGARPREVSAALRERVAELRKLLPEGLDLAIACDFTPNLEAADRPETPEYLLLDPTLPPSTSPARAVEILKHCTTWLQQLPGVEHVLTLTENPFDFARDRPCILVRLTAGDGKPTVRERVASAVRTKLPKVEDVTVRLRDLSGPGRFPRCGYAIDLAVRGPEAQEVRRLAETLAQRLDRTPTLTGAWADSDSRPHPQLYLEVDRTKAAQLGVDLKDVSSTLQVFTGGAPAGDFNRFGRTWQVTVQGDAGAGKQAEDLKQLKVRNNSGKMVPLSTFVTVHDVDGPLVIDRLDLQPMVEVTANPASGVSLAEARRVCESAAAAELPAAYRLTWLQDSSAAEPAGPGPRTRAAEAAPPEGSPTVAVSRPVVREVTNYADFTGRTQAVSTVEIRARVTGYLDKVMFKEGFEVKQGDVLFEIDPRPYRAQLDQAASQVELSKAQLELARATYDRDRALPAGAISRQQLDEDKARVNDALAHVKAEQAGLEMYQLNLEFTRVLAPINGRIGRRFVDPGNLVKADDTSLAVIVSQDPMYVYFDLDERTVLRLRRLAREGKIKSPREAATPAFLALADEVGYPRQGAFDFADNRVAPETGTLSVRAVFPNPDGLLSPGMFVRVRLPIGAPFKALLVTERAVGSDQGLKFVYVVNDQNQVDYKRVTVGPLQPDGLVVIEKGLQPGERVLVSGLQRVRPRMVVQQELVPMPVLSPESGR